MSIKGLANQAIEQINSMSLDELEEKFIQHGYPRERKFLHRYYTYLTIELYAEFRNYFLKHNLDKNSEVNMFIEGLQIDDYTIYSCLYIVDKTKSLEDFIYPWDRFNNVDVELSSLNDFLNLIK